jgi:catalase
MPSRAFTNQAFAQQLLDAIDAVQGLHPGFRPAHAKGLMCAGVFTPSPEAANLTRAPHASRPSTPVTVRYSNGTGVPTIPDNDPARSGPRGMAIRFHLAEHVHTDIVAHSVNGFPVRTGEEFLELQRAAAALGADHPEALGSFLAAHPNAMRFVETPKPIPTSFTREAFFAVTPFKCRHGRFRIRPAAGTEYLSNEAAAAKSENFLFDEIGPRLAKEPVKLGVFVQGVLLPNVRCRFFDQSRDLFRPGDIDRVAGAGDFDLVAVGSCGIPSFELGVNGSVLRRYQHPTRFASPGRHGNDRCEIAGCGEYLRSRHERGLLSRQVSSEVFMKLRGVEVRETIRRLLYRRGLAEVTRKPLSGHRLTLSSIRHVGRDVH